MNMKSAQRGLEHILVPSTYNQMAKLKKGSAAAKAWGRKMKRIRNSKSKKSSPKRRGRTIKQPTKSYKVAKRRYRAKKKSYSRRRTFGGAEKYIAPLLYGMGRKKVSDFLASKNITQKIPLGAISDETAMFGTAWALKKFLFKRKSVIRDALSSGQQIEMAMIGESIASGQVNLGALGGSTTETSSNGYVFAQ